MIVCFLSTCSITSYSTTPIKLRKGTALATVFNESITIEQEQILVNPSAQLDRARIVRTYKIACKKNVALPFIVFNQGVHDLNVIIDSIEVMPALIRRDSSNAFIQSLTGFNDTLFSHEFERFLQDNLGDLGYSQKYLALNTPNYNLNQGKHTIELRYSRLSREISHPQIRSLNGNEIKIDYTIGANRRRVDLDPLVDTVDLKSSKEIQKIYLRSADQSYIENEVHSFKYFPKTNFITRGILHFGVGLIALFSFLIFALFQIVYFIKLRVQGGFTGFAVFLLSFWPVSLCFIVYLLAHAVLYFGVGSQFYDQIGLMIYIHISMLIAILICYPILVFVVDLMVKLIQKRVTIK